MTEEQVTKAIITALDKCGWAILSFDFPQSGSGKMLHPNDHCTEKNRGGIIPDIIALKDSTCLFFENKDRVVIDDFVKISSLINDNQYTNDIDKLLDKYTVKKILYGIGFPSNKWNKQVALNSSLVDFIIGVSLDKNIEFLYNPQNIVIQ